jgi:hypothetical protein
MNNAGRMRTLAIVLFALAFAGPVAEASSGDLYVLAINGGGDKQDNFASHLAHLRQLVDLLGAAGIPRDRVTVLAGDGADPAPDLATREPEPENAWLLQGTRLDAALRDLTIYESSRLPGVILRPATVRSLTHAIAELRTRLRPGDTVLIYVTDHGTQSRRDPTGNRITLWGAHESISVNGLGELLARLPKDVRVVSLMSQCFSGGFAYLHESREKSRTPRGTTCGYFSSTPDRPAYGCYPEVRGQKAVGHSFEFLQALAGRGRFPAAHTDVLQSDDTPDIPLRSSDVYLAELLGRHTPSRTDVAAFADTLWQGVPAPAESQLLDHIAARFGVPHPTSLVELNEQVDRLLGLLDRLDVDARVWESALADFNRANLDAFLAGRADWQPRLESANLRDLDPTDRRARSLSLVEDLHAFVAADAVRLAEANRLVAGLSTSDEVGYRTEIRVAALLRMRFVLTTLAGRAWVKQHPMEADALRALERCEDLALSLPAAGLVSVRPIGSRLPALADDERLAAGMRPGWIGVTFVPVSRGRRERLHLSAGAATITSVLPRSPAADAGLRVGDIVEGAVEHPFAHPLALRPFIAATSIGTALALDVRRGGGRIVIKTVVRETPAPPKRQ